MDISKLCILGGTGFVGRHLIPKLSAAGVECLVLSRNPQRHRELAVNPGCTVVQADVFDKTALSQHFEGCDGVINLIGILNENRKYNFRRMHVELVDLILSVARQTGIKRLLHMSALNADAGSGSSLYLRTKGEGENRAHTGGKPEIAVTSFRPSVIFGPDDHFINRFVSLVKIPGPLPLACSKSRFAPVYVEDVCHAMTNSLFDKTTFGQRFELCGPRIYSLREIVKYIAIQSGVSKIILDLPDSLSKLQANILEFVPGKPFTYDNYLSLQEDSICSETAYNLKSLHVTPTRMDAVVPLFLSGKKERQRYEDLRKVDPDKHL